MRDYPIIDWNGLYGEGWGDDIVPEAFSHPAKYSRALIRHIYQYLIDGGLLKRGQRVIDPFGGVALGALDAQLQGLHWVGCELEPKFVELGNANLALWLTRYAPYFPRWGSAVLLQGDSRRIGEVVRGAGGIVSSPPFAGVVATQDPDFLTPGEREKIVHSKSNDSDYGTSPGQLGAMPSGSVEAILSSPPYAESLQGDNARDYTPDELQAKIDAGESLKRARWGSDARGVLSGKEYGKSAGQLGAMPSGDYGAVIASPPFIGADKMQPAGQMPSTPVRSKVNAQGRQPEEHGQSSDGNLGAMSARDTDFSAIIASPPFLQTSGGTNVTSPDGPLADASLITRHSAGNASAHGYGESEGQLQSMSEGDYNAIIASPPYAGSIDEKRNLHSEAERRLSEETKNRVSYGTADGTLGSLPEGDVNAIIASPPYNQAIESRNGPSGLMGGTFRLGRSDMQANAEGYGHTPGQLANAPEGAFSSVVSSPPYEGAGVGDLGNYASPSSLPDNVGDLFKAAGGNHKDYGRADGQLGGEVGDTFWSAALTIVTECYKLLAPGSVAVWICKDYVRNKKRVPFSDQWRQLCEKVGFTTLTEVHAWVVEDNGTQLGMMDTSDKHHKTERKSFFRRLAEKKGSPRIDWETVWIMRKEAP